ncbi:hypothetical protein [Shewanella algae]|uniref:hypothetical protein n=1 Tax=Shewanella algae TaxID=38313 RepID=UPI0031F5421B
MKKIIFIDDDGDVRKTYEMSMKMMFGEEFEIVCLDAEPTLKRMMEVLDSIPDKVSYFIDEKLKHSGNATYAGLDLVEYIRRLDSKVPIYILTSFSDEIEQYLGDIEFVIDKNHWESNEDEENFKKRILRHINTYKDIKSKQSQRFEKLLEKSIFSSLSEEEIEEFNALNINRSKKIVSERLISDESLIQLKLTSDELDRILLELNGGNDE